MTQKQIELVRSSWTSVSALDPLIVGEIFYAKLFEKGPELKSLFTRTAMPEQSKKLLAMLNYIIGKLDKLSLIVDEVRKLAIRHISYGVKPGHYSIVGQALLATLETGLGENWNEELKQAWSVCYSLLSEAMINTAAAPEQAAA
jgi:nitric oxide dioxygenase